MYKCLEINGEEYKLEYSIEASLYADCIASITSMFANIGEAASKKDIAKSLQELGNVPQVVLTVFYAGLMEYHGTHPQGDKKVPDKQTAKLLIKKYFEEHKDDETGNFYGFLSMCIEQMREDGFFSLTGMDSLLEITEEMKGQKKKPRKVQMKTV